MRVEQWDVLLVSEVEDWFMSLVRDDGATANLVEDALELLAVEGPMLGRPLVDSITGSRIRNMKELRPGSTGRTEVRILFVFDPQRRAVLLVAGDKSTDWRGWCRSSVPLAERRYAAHIEEIETREYQ